jgi:hypothetical protein
MSIDPRRDQGITNFLYGPNSNSFTTVKTSILFEDEGRAKIYRRYPTLKSKRTYTIFVFLRHIKNTVPFASMESNFSFKTTCTASKMALNR